MLFRSITPLKYAVLETNEEKNNWSGHRRNSTNLAGNKSAAITSKPPTAPVGFRKASSVQPKQSNSLFVADDSSLINVGMIVEHEKFGQGKVISMEGRFPDSKALILFEGFGQKQLLLKFAKLKIIG